MEIKIEELEIIPRSLRIPSNSSIERKDSDINATYIT